MFISYPSIKTLNIIILRIEIEDITSFILLEKKERNKMKSGYKRGQEGWNKEARKKWLRDNTQ